MARPSIFTPELVEAICARIEAGEPLAEVCRDPTMPGVRTVLEWAKTNEAFAAMYASARDAQAEHLDAEINRIAKTAVDKDTAAAARVQITALTWRASKMSPRRYGDRLDLNVDHSFDLSAVLDKGRQRVLDANARLGLPSDAEQ